MLKNQKSCLVVLVALCLFGLLSQVSSAAQFKVLVVMSYEETMPWHQEIKEGIDKGLSETCELKYFYMDTKTNLEGGAQKAEEAYALYQEFQPDGVIVSDDNAQSMFVLKYLKDKVKTPVIFCGVNAEPEKYGYPAENVTGILERQHNKEAIAFAKQLLPAIKTFGYMIKKSPVGDILTKHIQSEADTYPAKFIGDKMPSTLKETVEMTKELKEKSDILLLSTLTGVLGDDGKPLTDKEVIPIIAEAYGKPLLGTELQIVKAGALCTVLRTGQEQGSVAAKMLLKAMQGTPISEIPITQNRAGKRVINVTVMKALGIKPKPEVLRSAELVKTEQ